MRMDLQQKIVDLQEVMSFGWWLRLSNESDLKSTGFRSFTLASV